MATVGAGVFYCSVVVAFWFSFGIGANDVANSFGTSVGSGAFTLRRAVLVASVCELSGAVTLGRGVSDTIVRQISHLDEAGCWNCTSAGSPGAMLFMLGMACALLSGMLFMLSATFFGMPVSTTHAIVGAVLGMTVVGAGSACVSWGYPGLLTIVASWFVSPLLAGILSAAMHLVVQMVVFKAQNPFKVAMRALPLLYGASVGIVLSLVLIKAEPTHAWPAWLTAVVALAVAVAVVAAVQLLLVPQLRQNIHSWGPGRVGSAPSDLTAREAAASPEPKTSVLPYEPGLNSDGSELTGLLQQDRQQRTTTDASESWVLSVDSALNSIGDMQLLYTEPSAAASTDAQEISLATPSNEPATDQITGHPQLSTPPSTLTTGEHHDPQGQHHHPCDQARQAAAAEQVFLYLQVLTACLKSFAHGANDTANAAGPFAAVQSLYLSNAGCESITTPFWVLAFCGFGIVVGLSTWGHRVMKTVGKDLVAINFSKGFAIELGSTLSVVLASVVGMPVSSTHCQIGSIVAVGIAETGVRSIEWSVLSKIVVSWLVTVPLAAGAAALLLLAFDSLLHAP